MAPAADDDPVDAHRSNLALVETRLRRIRLLATGILVALTTASAAALVPGPSPSGRLDIDGNTSLEVAGLVPGAERTWSIAFRNEGGDTGALRLRIEVTDDVGAYGGALSKDLLLTVDELAPHTPARRVFSGPPAVDRTLRLAPLRPAELRTYRILVRLRSDARDDVQGSATRVVFRWAAG